MLVCNSMMPPPPLPHSADILYTDFILLIIIFLAYEFLHYPNLLRCESSILPSPGRLYPIVQDASQIFNLYMVCRVLPQKKKLFRNALDSAVSREAFISR